MKTSFSLIVLCLVVNSIYAQFDPTAPPFSTEKILQEHFEVLNPNTHLQFRGEEFLHMASRRDDWNNDHWIPVDSIQYTYDENGLRTSYTMLRLNDLIWENLQKVTLTNEEGLRVEVVRQSWNGFIWENYGRSTYEYENDLISVITDYSWIGNQWQNSYRITFIYDINGNQVEMLEEIWDGQDWLDWAKTEYLNDAEGKRIESLNRFYDTDLGEFVNTAKTAYFYNSEDLLLEILNAKWEGGDWVEWNKNFWEYNNEGNPILSVRQNYDSNTGTYENQYNFTYEYDEDQNNTLIIFQTWEYNSWWNDSKYVRYYEKALSGTVQHHAEASISIAPNPAQNFVRLKYSEELTPTQIRVWSNDGRLLETIDPGSNTGQVEINTAHWLSGNYVIQVIGEDFNTSQKVIKL